jgi:NAD(P)-dependent dehydrogenase (short-subunit alcohol dehydrogenase family)
MELENKVAIVTGSSRGLGKIWAIALAQAGASVVVTARTEKDAGKTAVVHLPGEHFTGRGNRVFTGELPGTIYETAAEIEAMGGTALPVRCDVVREDEIKSMVDTTLEHFGRIDIVVNNAGIFPRFNLLEITPEIFDRVFHVNLRGQYLVCKHVLPHMIERGRGSIINVTTGGGNPALQKLKAAESMLCYTVTKAGVTRLTTYIAQEVAQYGIAVNAVAPGLVQSPGGEEIMPEDYKFEGGEIDWKPATLEVLGPYMVWLAQQSAATFTGQVVQGEEFGQTWP